MAEEKAPETAKNEKKTTTKADDFILQVRHLKMYFPTQTGFFKTRDLKAVDDVSFEVKRGETIGVVGESGCGKTTLGRTILHLYDPTDGEIIFNGREIRSKKNYKATLAKLKSDYLAAIKKEQDSLAKIAKAEQEKLDKEKAKLEAEKAKETKKETKPEAKPEPTTNP